ncbi:lactadherin isoform X2 [Ornithorhynchus anatinus]|uniref:lactadherin isoform X2 n=1 Tax=Ornithorhynchus anatinus TaxID=9258 RepID=UPI0010A7C574|nr:lactadherin isoform X2 [Ornithorhynchus anatinus]
MKDHSLGQALGGWTSGWTWAWARAWTLAACLAVALASPDVCESNLCQNGGTCLSEVNGSPFFCICPEGFTGTVCNETERGPCFPNPCLNNGECEVLTDSHRGDVFAQYFCKCPVGYKGIHCQENENECSSKPCLNGGTCLDLEGDYACKCRSPFLGKTCKFRCAAPLGMETGAIADAQISASSVHFGFLGLQRWGPELARLNGKGIVNAWTAGNYDKKSWIQVNLLRKTRVTGIVTQGASRAGSAEYLRTFRVAYSLDGHDFAFIRDPEEKRDKVFVGNVDNNGWKQNLFEPPIVAQYVRIHPLACRRGCTLRFELYGCEMNGCSEPLGMKSHLIRDKQITASSTYKTWGLDAFSWHPYFARLDKKGKSNAWAAKGNEATEWLQIDLGTRKQVTGIITQGARDFGHIQYVAAYRVAHSDDGKTWTEYQDSITKDTKIFHGNSDNNSHKKNVFDQPFYARFVRILPTAWHDRITLRVELLGCDE